MTNRATWILIFCLLSSSLYSQSTHIREIKFRPKPKYYNTADSTIIYPVIVTGDPAVSRSINKVIKEQLLDPEYAKMGTREALRRMIGNGLTDLSYEVTYCKNGILSITIDIGVVAAYSSSWQRYFNFDVRTGRYLELKDIVSNKTFEQLKAKVFADKVDSLKNYKEGELKGRLLSGEIDSVDYRWAAGIVDSDCIASIKLDNFSLSQAGIDIFDECEFPHVIRGMEPVYALKYSYRFLFPYLRPEFQKRLATE